MDQRPGLVLGQRLQPVAPNLFKITNISILVVPNIPTTRMLISLILIILPATPFPLSPSIPHCSCSRTPFPLSQHSTPLLFPHAIPLIPSIPHHSYSRTPFPLSPSIPHRSYSHTPFPLSPAFPHHSYSRTPFPLSQHSTPLLFPHAIPLIPAFHTAPIPARHSPYPQHSTPLLFPRTIPLIHPSIPHRSCSRTPDTAHSPVTDPVEASAHPMLDGDSLPVRYGVHGQRPA